MGDRILLCDAPDGTRFVDGLGRAWVVVGAAPLEPGVVVCRCERDPRKDAHSIVETEGLVDRWAEWIEVEVMS